MRRIKRKIKVKKSNIFISLLIILIFFSLYIMYYVSNKLNPKLFEYAEAKTTTLVVDIINKNITNEIASNLLDKELFITTLDEEGYITSINLNTSTTNKIISEATNIANDSLLSIENKEIYKIPIGLALDNSLLTNLLPSVPVRVSLLSSADSQIKTNVSNYSINTSVIEVSLDLTISISVMLPFKSESATVETNIPLAVKLIQGKVPSFYSGNLQTD